MKSPIFIVGPHRSGSTLWHNLVAMCPGVMRLPEPRFLSVSNQRDFKFFLNCQARDLSTDDAVKTLVELCFARKSFPGLEGAFWRFENLPAANDPKLREAVVQRIKDSDRSLGAIGRIIIEEVTRFSGYSRACVKFPVDVGHIEELMEWFPDGKVMHITRDPRAMAMSKSNDPSGTALKVFEHPRLAWFIRKIAIGYVIAQYRRTARLHQQFKGLQNYRLFRYEDLLADPEKVLRDLCNFIDVEFTNDLLELQKGSHEHQPSSLTGKRQKAFDPEAATRWQSAIPALDKWIITLLTKGSMRKLDYNPRTHPVFSAGSRINAGQPRPAVSEV